MLTPPIPSPMPFAFQAKGGPPLGHCLSKPVSLETPSRSPPRHCGQSPTDAEASDCVTEPVSGLAGLSAAQMTCNARIERMKIAATVFLRKCERPIWLVKSLMIRVIFDPFQKRSSHSRQRRAIILEPARRMSHGQKPPPDRTREGSIRWTPGEHDDSPFSNVHRRSPQRDRSGDQRDSA